MRGEKRRDAACPQEEERKRERGREEATLNEKEAETSFRDFFFCVCVWECMGVCVWGMCTAPLKCTQRRKGKRKTKHSGGEREKKTNHRIFSLGRGR